MTLVLALSACAARVPATVRPPVEAQDMFVLQAAGRSLGGTAVISVTDDAFALLGLGPTGTALFRVEGAGGAVAVTAPDDRMAEVLARMPVERDLWLLYRLRCAERCRAEHGTLRVDGDTATWRGRGGRATVVLGEGRAVLEDARRGYVLTVAGAGLDE